ncbi:Hydroxypyruvate isomerase [Posidoniimonas corsicana]|uniref:Hydroxypyruvate isomerase n=1 Tax=Posidoniimonas corsicana TaxID=1938618 RepID=A0A5C5VEJ0_9BACT|nr:TIM barrel protein [Posidoniimonas corsicana]TWT37048.1 Hydroxypyruvate isomerase [Posidoniimonas corsicana]
MQRRDFLTTAAAAGIAAAAGTTSAQQAAEPKRRFHLKYAPHFTLFDNLAGRDQVAQLEFAADQGFTAWEWNEAKMKSADEQERVAKAMDRLGMTMGVFVAYGIGSFGKKSFTSDDQGMKEQVLKEITESVEVAKRVNAKWMTVVPGAYDNHLEEGYQTANCIELLKRCSEILEPHGLVMVLEPLNWWANHPGLFLRETPQAFNICRAVDSPACKILFDIYHQQIQEGNLIPNIDRAYSEIGYFQCGDNPGRKEPGTGEINYKNVFKHIYEKGFEGVMGMEHGKSIGGKEGDQALIDAYVQADSF